MKAQDSWVSIPEYIPTLRLTRRTQAPSESKQPVHPEHPKLGIASDSFEYLDRESKVVCTACRFDVSPDSKEFRPLTYGEFNGVLGRYWRKPNGLMPLFQLPKIYAATWNQSAIVFEGEKTTNAGQEIFQNYICTTSFGGANGAKGTNWKPLQKCKVYVFPDNDANGLIYQQSVIDELHRLGNDQVYAVRLPKGFPPKWDVADSLPDGVNRGKLYELIRDAEHVPIAPPKKEEKEPSLTVQIIQAVEATPKFDFFLNQFDEACVRYVEKNDCSSVKLVSSVRFKRFVAQIAFETFNDAVSKETVDKVCNIFEAKAYSEENISCVYVRSAFHNGHVYYDLGDQIACISKEGVTFTKESPVAFTRYGVFKTQAAPLATGTKLSNFLELLNIPDKRERLLLQCFIVTAFIPDIAHPVLAIFGQQGSAKSTLMKLLVRLIDPAAIEDVQIQCPQELIQAASHRLVLPLDNLSQLSEAVSDLLCKLVTGGGYSKRMLYSNDDDLIRSYRRIVVLNGISLVVEKPDLLDRSLLLQLERIKPENRLEESEVFAKFEAMRPGLLAEIFELVSNVLRYRDEARKTISKLPRMADFAIYGRAAAKALGFSFEDFDEAYEDNIDRQNLEALEASPLASAIAYYLRSEDVLMGTPSTVRKKLAQVWEKAGLDPNDAPRCHRSLGIRLSAATPNLTALGYQVSRKKMGGERHITVKSPRLAQDVHTTKPAHDSELSEDVTQSHNVSLNAQLKPSANGSLDVLGVTDKKSATEFLSCGGSHE